MFLTMKSFVLFPLLAGAGVMFGGSLCAADVTPPAGFEPLFNGKDLSGWMGWSTRDPRELWGMSEEERAEWNRRSVEGPLEGKDEGKGAAGGAERVF
jgi:hypothetical protein